MNWQGCARDPEAIMRREMTVRFGPVPSTVPDAFYEDDGVLTISNEAFVFVTMGGVRFHYRRGEGVVVDLSQDQADEGDSDFELFLWGTVFGAVAWLNGLVPLHASAIDISGRVVAFTADSGGESRRLRQVWRRSATRMSATIRLWSRSMETKSQPWQTRSRSNYGVTRFRC